MGFWLRLKVWRDELYQHPVMLWVLIAWFVLSLPFGNPLSWFLDKRYGEAVYNYLTQRLPAISLPGLAFIASHWTRINVSAFLLLLTLLLVIAWRESRPLYVFRREDRDASEEAHRRASTPKKRGAEPVYHLGLCWTLTRTFFESYETLDEPGDAWGEDCVSGPYCPRCRESLVRKVPYDWGGGTYSVIAAECENEHAVDPAPLRNDASLPTAKARVYRYAAALLRDGTPLPPWPPTSQ